MKPNVTSRIIIIVMMRLRRARRRSLEGKRRQKQKERNMSESLSLVEKLACSVSQRGLHVYIVDGCLEDRMVIVWC